MTNSMSTFCCSSRTSRKDTCFCRSGSSWLSLQEASGDADLISHFDEHRVRYSVRSRLTTFKLLIPLPTHTFDLFLSFPCPVYEAAKLHFKRATT